MLKEVVHFQLFGHAIVIYGYGLMLVVAFVVCVFATRILARKNGIDPEHAINAATIALLTGIIGARIADVLENFRQYTSPDRSFWENLLSAIDIHNGGLTFYGGFILATPCCIAYAWLKKIPILRGMDIVAPVLMIGLGIGRIGCLLNGCCYGEQCSLPWAVRFPYYSDAYIQQFDNGQVRPPLPLIRPVGLAGMELVSPDSLAMQDDPELASLAASSRALPVHPAEIYSTITAFLLAALLISYMTIRRIDGRVFALMLILEGASRFILELIRVEANVWTITWRGQTYGMSLSMVLGLQCVIAGFIMWYVLGVNATRHPTKMN